MSDDRLDRRSSNRAKTVGGRAAELRALVAGQAGADLDQGAADADQAASDADQVASTRDDDDALADQRCADRDQATADEQQAGAAGAAMLGAYESRRAARMASRIDRLAAHASRADSARARLGAAGRRDRNASARDDTALRREMRSLSLEERIEASDAPAPEKFDLLRAQAASDRARAAADRRRAATARAAAADERVSLEAELHSAHLDDLTGAFRREMGMRALDLEIDRSRRADGRFVLTFVDVDGLKAVNDRAGHAAGDLVLRTLVGTMRSRLRSFDPIVRLGGDEFVCGIAGVDPAEVGRRFDGIGQSLYADTGVGFSIGMAVLEDADTLERVMARADAALLTAKGSRPG